MSRLSLPISILVLLSVIAVCVPASASQNPTARITMHLDNSNSPLEYVFDATASSDSDGHIERYAWDFGDDTGSSIGRTRHAYESPGEYVVSLVVIDDSGDSDMATRTVYVSGRLSSSTLGSADVNQSANRKETPEVAPSYNAVAYGLVALLAILVLLLVKRVLRSGGIAKIRRLALLLRVRSTSSYSSEDLLKLSSREFEELVAQVWKRKGFKTQLTGRSADGGIDVVAVLNGRRFAIQAKRYSDTNSVGVRSIREYASLNLLSDIAGVIVVTSSRFTPSAIDAARRMEVELVNGADLLKLMNHYRIDIGRAIAVIRRLRKWRWTLSLLAIVASILLIILGQATSHRLYGIVIALLLMMSLVRPLRRAANRINPRDSLGNLAPANTSNDISDHETETLPLLDPPRCATTLRHDELRTKADVLSAYGKPELARHTSALDADGEIWRYHMPVMVFQFDSDGRIVTRYPE